MPYGRGISNAAIRLSVQCPSVCLSDTLSSTTVHSKAMVTTEH